MTQYLKFADANEAFLTAHGIPFHRARRTLRVGVPTAETTVPVDTPPGIRHNVPVRLLPLTIKLLDLMDWGLAYENHGYLMASRRHILLNTAVMDNRHDVAVRYRQARRSLRQASDLWDAVKGLRAHPMDRRMMQGVAMFAASWPETAYCVYDGDSFEDFDGKHQAGVGEVLIRFWPVVFRDSSHNNTRGVSIPMLFTIDEFGGIHHDFNDEQIQPHPHAFTDGSVCYGEARFEESQLESLKQLHNWYVGTDHAPAGGNEWSVYCKDWWEEHSGRFFDFYRDRQAYYVLAPETSMGHNSVASDRQLEAETKELGPTMLGRLLAEYAGDYSGDADDFETQCYICGTGLNEGDGYSCEYCDSDVCVDHYYGDDHCVTCWTERHTKCEVCGDWERNDDLSHCTYCAAPLCANCYLIDENDDTYCLNCKRDGQGKWEDGDEDFNTSPLAAQPALATGTTAPAPYTGPYRDQYWMADDAERWECEWPSHARYMGVAGAGVERVCRARAIWVHHPRPAIPGRFPSYEGDDCHMLCTEHYNLLPERGGVTPAPTTGPDTASDGGPVWADGWRPITEAGYVGPCTWRHYAYGTRLEVCAAPVAFQLGIGRRCYRHIPRPSLGFDTGHGEAHCFATAPVANPMTEPVEVLYREYYIPMEPAAWLCRAEVHIRENRTNPAPNATKRRLGGGEPEFLCDACYALLPVRGVGVDEGITLRGLVTGNLAAGYGTRIVINTIGDEIQGATRYVPAEEMEVTYGEADARVTAAAFNAFGWTQRFPLTKSMYTPYTNYPGGYQAVCEAPEHITWQESGCKTPAEWKLVGVRYTEPEPHYLCAACYNDIEMLTVGFWPMNENNLGARSIPMQYNAARRRPWPGATADDMLTRAVLFNNRINSENFMDAVVSAERMTRIWGPAEYLLGRVIQGTAQEVVARAPEPVIVPAYREDFAPQVGPGFVCEVIVEGHHCGARADWVGIRRQLTDRWGRVCHVHYERMPQSRTPPFETEWPFQETNIAAFGGTYLNRWIGSPTWLARTEAFMKWASESA